ncbi:CHAT domain-containing protein [Streptomyces sp. NPDC058457]|uniref:CHAT domain-containing protein n=1 Tax=Streptomyces sp. NPDC058457 TaxID=3346507 RepID=UPI0036674C87
METKEAALVRAAVAAQDLDEIEALLRRAVPFDGGGVLRELAAREEECTLTGRVAEARLLAYLRPVIEKAVRAYGFLAPEVWHIDSLDAWIDHAVTLPSLLDMFLSARGHRELFGSHGFSLAHQLVFGTGAQPRSDKHVMAVVAVGFAAGDFADREVARLLWAAVSRRAGRIVHAQRHIARAREGLGHVADGEARRGAYFYLAVSCHSVGDLDTAIEAYTCALDRDDASRDVVGRYALARCLRTAGRTGEALAALGGVDFDARQPGPLPEHELRALHLRGTLHEDAEEYDVAVADHETAVHMALALGDQHRELQARFSASGALSKAGRHREAVRAAETALLRARLWADPLRLADAHNRLGAALLAKGDKAAARAQYVAAMNCRGGVGPEGAGVSEAMSLFGLGDTEKGSEDNDGTDVLYRAALEHMRYGTDALTGLTHFLPRVVRPDRSLPDEYLSTLRAALRQSAASGNSWSYDKLAAVLADHQAATGRRTRAIALRRELLARAEEFASQSSAAIRERSKLAELLATEPDGCQEAFDLLWHARNALDEQVDQTRVAQRRSEILAPHLRIYDLLIHLLAHSDAPLALPDARDRDALAFDLHEEAKSRSFLGDLSRGTVPAPTGVPPSLLRREADLLVAERRLQQAQWVPGTRSGRTRFTRLEEVHAELTEIWEKVYPFAPEYVRLRRAQPVDLPRARDLLRRYAPDGGMALVSYFVGRDETTCFVLRSDDERLRIHRMAVADGQLARVVDQLRLAFNGDPTAFPPVAPLRGRHPERRSLAFLDAVGPELLSFTAHISGLPLVGIAPHGPLHLLPVHALPTGGGARLIDSVATAYCPSLSTLAQVMARGRTGDRPDANAFVAGVAAREDNDHALFEHDDSLLTAAGWPVRSVSGTDATRAAVLAGLAEADVAHLTCHGHFDRSDPLDSGLLLARGGARPSKDVRRLSVAQRREQMLTVRDLADVRTPLQLLVLRACSAGSLGRENTGDEFSGLVRAFLHAGAVGIIAPMWNVDQHSSHVFLTRLYQERHRHPGLPLWQLLRQTQHWMLGRDDQPWLAHPYHWAPFTLVGDWR